MRVSIIMPCYNAEKYIRKSIMSVINQTICQDDIELIVIDDKSQDASRDIVLELEKEYPDNIVFVGLDENGGPGRARNIGLQYSSGEYIGFVDADDYIEPNMYELLLDNAKRFDCDMVGGRIKLEYTDGSSVLMNNMVPVNETHDGALNDKSRMSLFLNGTSGGICTKVFRRDLILNNDIYFPQNIFFEDDYWLNLVLLYVKKYRQIDDVVYHYRSNPSSTVNNNDIRYATDRLVGQMALLKEYSQRGFLAKYLPGIEAKFIRSYYIDTYKAMEKHLGSIPKDLLDEMGETLRSLFPNGYNNQILLDSDREFVKKAYFNN